MLDAGRSRHWYFCDKTSDSATEYLIPPYFPTGLIFTVTKSPFLIKSYELQITFRALRYKHNVSIDCSQWTQYTRPVDSSQPKLFERNDRPMYLKHVLPEVKAHYIINTQAVCTRNKFYLHIKGKSLWKFKYNSKAN